jgi:hypothetical protein
MERMRITSNGNIGIGTNNPTNILQVGGGGRLRIANSTSDYTIIGSSDVDGATNPRIAIFGNTYGAGLSGVLNYYTTSATGYHAFHTTDNYIERLRITSNGNIGIGTSTVNYKLHVNGTTLLSGETFIAENTWIKDSANRVKLYFSSDSRTYFCGGTTSGTCITFRRGIDDGMIAEMYATGWLYIGGSLSQGSDSRIKMNIKDIDDEDALNLILAIEPKTYEYIDKETRGIDTVYGFIAQQVKEVIPRAIQIVSDILPNIYKICECEDDIIYCSIPQDVSINTEIKLRYINDKEVVHKILEIGEDYIRIDSVLEVNNIFVFGYNVDNFHRMSKEYIYTLNVCATQILSRKIDEQNVVIKSHEDRITDLEMKMERLLSSNT